MKQVPEDDLVRGLAERLNPYMRRILGGGEDPHAVVGELMVTLTEPPYFEHLSGVGELYQVWGGLSDIVDGYPVDYGPDSEAIAAREVNHAAQDWLGMPRTAAGLQDYLARRAGRLASLPTTRRASTSTTRPTATVTATAPDDEARAETRGDGGQDM